MLYKKIAGALVAFFIVAVASAYFFISKTTMGSSVVLGMSLALGAVGAMVGWIISGE